jgi:hypothetical protein
MKRKKVRKYESYITYPASFIIIGVKTLFHSDWLGASRQRFLLANAERRRDGKIR